VPFNTGDFQDLLRALKEHPEWQEELRRLLLAEPMAELAGVLRALVDALDQMREVIRTLATFQQQTSGVLNRLIEATIRLAEAQTHTEERLARLEEAQARTEERLARLAEAQARTEERLTRLEEAMARLAEAQARTEERVARLEEGQRRLEEALARLAEAQARTEEQVARLIQTQEHILQRLDRLEGMRREFESYKAMFGATLEEEAESMVRWVLEQKGYRAIGQGHPVILPVYEEGEKGEVDAVIPVQAPDRRILWAVVEAKARQSPRSIQAWANRMRSEGFRKRLAEAGVTGPYLVYAYGIRVDPSCEAMAEQMGIGLVTGRGERVPPAEEIPAVS